MLPSTQRLELFTDAVIAIAITLLVLQLEPVQFAGDLKESWGALEAIRSDFFGFIFSFAILSIYWVNHHQFFTQLRKSSNRLLWSNLFFTFWMSLIPFPTGLLGTNPKNPLAVMIYGLTLFMAALSFLLMHWLTRDSLKREYRKRDKKLLMQRAMVGPILYGLSIILAPVSVYISYAIFIIVPIFYFLPWRYFKKVMIEQ